ASMERAIERVHKHSTHQLHDRKLEIGALSRGNANRTSARNEIEIRFRVIERPKEAVVFLVEGTAVRLIPGVVSSRDDIHSHIKKLFDDFVRNPFSMSRVLTVDNDKIRCVLGRELINRGLDRLPTGLSKHI